MTSQNVVAYIKRLLNVNKAGHTGTLDPGAAGVLPVCIGKATRVSEYLINDKKSYRAEMCLGFSSDTLDKYGNIKDIGVPALSDDIIYSTFKNFEGLIEQIPPMYSAVKHNGERLYDLARRGITVDREKRRVYIYNIEILKIDKNYITFDVTCSKGTYIRTLCSDLGKALGSDAIMTFLLRTRTGPFTIDNSITLDEIKEVAENGSIETVLYPVESGLANFSKIYVNSELSFKVKTGNGFFLNRSVKYEKCSDSDIVLIFDNNDSFLAVGRIEGLNYIKIDKVFA